MSAEDVLWQAVEDLRSYQKHGVIACFGDPQLELVIDVMQAASSDPDRFAANLDSALARYRACVPVERA
jgi:hypothetical protein